jgi:hypothetical protein
VTRNPKLANHVHVERQAEALRNFIPDRNSAARKRQHDGIGSIGVDRKRLRELSARVGAVLKDYSGTPPSCSIICWVVTPPFLHVALGGNGSSATNFVGFCEKLNMSPIEVEVSSVV